MRVQQASYGVPITVMLKRNIVANYVGAAWNAIMGIAFVPLYVRYLGTEAYGVIGVSALISSLLSFFDLGLSPMLSREMARYRGGAHTAESIRSLLRVIELCSWSVGLLGMAALWLAAPWLASGWFRSESLGPDTLAHALRIMAAVIGLRFVEGMYRGVLIGLQRQVIVNVISSAAATMRGLGAIAVLGWWSPTLDAFFWWQGAVAIMSMAMFVISGYAALPRATATLTLGFETLRATWPFARGMLISSFLVLGLTQTDKLLLSRLLELSDYGKYMLALTASSCINSASMPICHALYPRLTELHATGATESFVYMFHRAAQLVMVVAGSIGVVLIVFADRIMLLWTGNPELAVAIATPFRLLCLGCLLNACMHAPYYCQLAIGWTSINNRVNAASILLVIPALLFAVPWAGTTGAAAVWAVLNAGYLLIGAPISFAKMMPKEMTRWYLHDLGIPLGSALVACLSIRAIGSIAIPLGLTDSIVLPAAVVTTLLTTLGAAPLARAQAASLVRRSSGAMAQRVTVRSR
jgi:O-antigen/teichoic acid export membrane protein